MIPRLFNVLTIVLFITVCTATTLDLCNLDPNATVTPTSSVTWGQALAETLRRFDGPSYLRPRIGGALQPWVLTVIILFQHIPVVIIRVVKWENVQIWCLVATLFTNVVVAQAYASTAFQADKILTWTPLLLVIDVGSMAQILFLVIEEFSLLTRLRATFHKREPSGMDDHLLADIEEAPEKVDTETFELHIPKSERLHTPHLHLRIAHPTPAEASLLQETPDVPQTFPIHIIRAETHASLFKSKPFYIALSSLLLLLSTIILQILGLAHATRSHRLPPPLVSFCSPIFQPFGITVLDGNCNNHPVQHNGHGYSSNGVGCILLPGYIQQSWLRATVAGTSLSLVLQTIDLTLLATVSSGYRWRGVKMRRPWCTIIGGVAILFLLLVFGIVYGDMLPSGITSKVWVVRQEGEGVGVYEGWLGPAGLRGAIIGWCDGVFEAWGGTYSGHFLG